MQSNFPLAAQSTEFRIRMQEKNMTVQQNLQTVYAGPYVHQNGQSKNTKNLSRLQKLN